MPAFRLQVEVDAGVDAAVAEVAVERAFVTVGGHHLAQITEVAAKFFGGDCGVFPTFPGHGFSGHVRSHAESGFADFPHAFDLLLAGIQPHVRWMGAVGERLHQGAGLGFGFPRGFGAEFDHQPSSAFGQERQAFGVDSLQARIADEKIVDAFEANGLVRHDFGDVIGALKNIWIGDDQQHALGRAFDQTASRFEHCDAGAFRSDQRPRNVESVLGKKKIQVVAGDAARNFGKALADKIAIVVGEVFNPA